MGLYILDLEMLAEINDEYFESRIMCTGNILINEDDGAMCLNNYLSYLA